MSLNRKEGYYKRAGMQVFFMALPFLCIIFIFNYLPLWGWAFAFFNYRPGLSLLDCEFVGFSHFTRLFGNPVLFSQLINSLKNTLGIVSIGWLFSPLPMLFAILLSEVRFKIYQRVVQTITTLPNFVSWIIVYSLMFSLLNVNTGAVNELLSFLGFPRVNFLISSDNVWFKMWLIGAWKGLGWSAIIYFAAIAGIDKTLFEAAMVDGANRIQKIWYITLPCLLPTYFVLFIISIGSFLSTGMEQYLIFQNPLNKESIEVLDLYVFNIGITRGQISFGTAIGMMKSTISIIMFSAANVLSKYIRGESVF